MTKAKPTKPAKERGSAEPLDGKCGAKMRNIKRYCTNPPVTGHHRCPQHGGKGTGGRKPNARAKNAVKFRLRSARGQDRLAQVLDDPELLNLKRPAALATMIIEDIDLPTDDDVADMAQRFADLRASKEDRANGESLEPTIDEYAKAKRELAQTALRAVEVLGRRQESALKAEKMGKLLLAEINPIMETLGRSLMELAVEFVPDNQRQAYMSALRLRLGIVLESLANIDLE